MKLLDANILVYAYNSGLPEHERARRWLEATLQDPGVIGLTWVTILAFLRIATNPRFFQAAYSTDEACGIVSDWLRRSNVLVAEPRERHWEILASLIGKTQARADLIMDAHLAAIAIEHGAVVCTNDRDFARFPGLKTLNPLES
ncbi:MAG: type II toxin-antitoxin system VapC family toxin [Thermoanaerobaculia bacterium]